MKEKRVIKLSVKTLAYLVIFSITILLILTIAKDLIISYSYEKYQERKINNLAQKVHDYEIDELYSKLENIAYDNSVCIKYLTTTNTINYNTLMVGCELNNSGINSILNNIIRDNKEIKNLKLVNEDNDKKAILSGVKVDNGYVFIYSLLEDTNSANIILRNQVIYITIIVIILACFIAYFISIKITKPITNITLKAKELGEGNYNIHFDRSDILEINELSKTLEHVGEDLSKIDELRRDLLANVSHDLKTPLTMIKAYAEMVRDITYKDKEKREKDLNVIIDEAERLNILVNDILTLSKMQANSDVLTLEQFDLCEVIRDVLKRYDILRTMEDYEFIVNVPDKAIVLADKQKIIQVIYNLVNNAINYTGEDKKVFINVINNKKEYVVEIKDTGKGIKKEEINYIWDKYYRVEKKHQRNVVSTGIGLSIVKEVLSKHKFDYGVKSKEGVGTTFYFKIRK